MLQPINKYIVYYPAQFFRHEHIWNILPELATTELFDKSKLQDYLTGKLKTFMDSLYYHSRFYGKHLKELGYDPRNEFNWDIFHKIQIVDKEKIKQIGYDSLSVDSSVQTSWRSTSGSTGQPFVFPKDRVSTAYSESTMYQCYSWYGIKIGDKQGRIWGTPLKPHKRLYQKLRDRLLNRRRLSAFNTSEVECQAFLRKLQSFRPAFIYGYPNAISLFAEYLSRIRFEGRDLSLKAVICTGEILLPQHREFIKKVFCTHVANEYGTTENGVIAFECEKGNMHVMSQNIFLECVDQAEKPVPDGVVGKFVITEFHSLKIPFVRYTTGDIGRILKSSCPCGRPYPLIDIQVGRTDNFILTPDGRKVYDAILAYAFKDVFKQFKAFQDSIELLLIKYVPAKDLSFHEIETLEKILRQHLGDKIRIRFEKTDVIPTEPSGKMRYFIGLPR